MNTIKNIKNIMNIEHTFWFVLPRTKHFKLLFFSCADAKVFLDQLKIARVRCVMSTDSEFKVESVNPMTLTDRAVYEAAKNSISESPKVIRDFCQFMITISISSIPAYIALLNFIVNTRHVTLSSNDFYVIIPTAFFIFSAILFAIVYLPRYMNISLDTMDTIRLARIKMVTHRMRIVVISFSIFVVGLISAVTSMFYIMIVISPT